MPCAAKVRKKLCICCNNCGDNEEESGSDTDSESGSRGSSASFSSCDESEWALASSPQPRQNQEWDSLFFTPEMLAPALEPVSQVSNSSDALMGSMPASPKPMMQQQSLILGMQSLQMTNSLNIYASNLPEPEPPASTPLLKSFLARVSMSDVRRAMRQEPFWYCRYLKKSRKCHDIKKYRWAVGSAAQGNPGLVRGVRFVMPLPQDLPSWLLKSVQVPEETNGTTVVRLDGAGQSPDNEEDLQGIADAQPVVLVMQTCSHDAPYGEHFRVQETLRFVRVDKGVELQRWVEVIWVKSLPWALGALRRIIETKTVTGAEEAQGDIVRIIQQAIDHAAT